VDAISYAPAALPAIMSVSRVAFRASGIPQIFVTNEEAVTASVLFGGITHSALGNATLTVQSNQLAIGNLGASGQDGVSIPIPEALTNWGLKWESPDPSNSLPVGARLQVQEFGTANNVTNGLLGTLTVTKTGSNSVLSVDYTPCGITEFTVQLCNSNGILAQATNVGTGPACYCIDVTEGQPPNTVKTGDFLFNRYALHSWYDGVLVAFVPNGTAYPATYAVIIPGNRGLPRPPTSISLLAYEVPAIDVTNEFGAPITLTAAAAGNSLNLQWYGTGSLQESPDLSTWIDLPGSMSPDLVPMTSPKQFFRVKQATSGDGDY
jgi:hypothetical protein